MKKRPVFVTLEIESEATLRELTRAKSWHHFAPSGLLSIVVQAQANVRRGEKRARRARTRAKRAR